MARVIFSSGILAVAIFFVAVNAFSLGSTKVNKISAAPPPTNFTKLNIKGGLRYTLGNKTSTDKLLDTGLDFDYSSQPQNYQRQIKYPKFGSGSNVTYIEIDVTQDGLGGRAFVLGGGLYQKNVTFVFEAVYTKSVKYNYTIYGKW